jgi:hypothetical protein
VTQPTEPTEPTPAGAVPGVPPPVPPVRPRRPSTLGGLVYLLVTVASAVGLGVIAFGPWRRGVALIGIALLVAALARVVLSDFGAGMLRVRSKWFDVLLLTGVGVVLIVLAANIPNQVT